MYHTHRMTRERTKDLIAMAAVLLAIFGGLAIWCFGMGALFAYYF